MKWLLWLSRILLALVFIFSGFVKAIDPLGSAYKFQDYFVAFGTEWLFFAALPLAILLSTLEFVIGLGVLFGIKMRLSALGGLLFMAFFTPLTLYIAITDPVPDCGCFGDAIIISNWETFYKNIFILAAAIVVFIYRKRVKVPWRTRTDNVLMLIAVAGVLGLSFYCLRNLPVIDFRPWKVGNDVSQLVLPTEEIARVYLVYEHKGSGETREYAPDELPWDDPDWAASWQFKEQRREVMQAYREAEIDAFYIEDEFGDDLTDFYITQPGYLFIVVAHDLYQTRVGAFHRRITPLAREAEEMGYPLIVLTGSSADVMEEFRHEHQTPYPFYLSDEIELKTMIRSNPGLLVMKEGVVKGKWAHRNIPNLEKILGKLEE